MEQRHAAQVGGLTAPENLPAARDSKGIRWCVQVQHHSNGGVAESHQPISEQRCSHAGAHHPGRPAAAGEEEDESGR